MECTEDYRFLYDCASIDFVKKSTVMFIMRGLPGSGKTYLANRIKKVYPDAKSCSADDYFVNEEGIYVFDDQKLSDAHQQCENLAREYMTDGIRHIIIDNTNIRRYFVKKYIRLAKKYGYIAIVVAANSPWCTDPKQLAEKNSHGLTLEQLDKKLKLYQELYPAYWGWFLSDCNTEGYGSLTDLAIKAFSLCIDHIPEFKQCIQLRFDGREDFCEIYSSGQPWRPCRQLHCTAFYAGPAGKDKPEVQAYANREVVKQSLHKRFTLRIEGFIFSPETVGACVALDDNELALWGNDVDDLSISSLYPQTYQAAEVEEEENSGKVKVKKQRAKRASNRNNKKIGKNNSKVVTSETCDISEPNIEENRDNLDALCFETLEESASIDCPDSYSQDSTIMDTCAINVSNITISTKTNDNQLNNTENVLTHDGGINSCDVDKESSIQASSMVNVANASKPKSALDKSKPESALDNPKVGAMIDKPKQKFVHASSTLPRGSKAHITIGCSAGVEPVQTGIDQLLVLECEREGPMVHIGNDEINGLHVFFIYYGNGLCSVYFENCPLFVDSIFSVSY